MIKFIIGGLPRSATTWLSVFLTTDDCVCLHDPSATMTQQELESWTGGICDTGLWYLEDWCKENTDKFILVDRDVAEVSSALRSKGLPQIPANLLIDFWDIKPSMRIFFETLFSEETARELWSYVYPEKPFNRERWLHLKSVYMSPIELEENK